jgi:hypothetical protein
MKTPSAPDFDGDCAAAVMFARIAALSPPDLPPGFAERIIRDVPRLAQMPGPARLPLRSGSGRKESGRAAPLVRVVASQQAGRTSPRRPLAAWSALAAGIAAVALMLPSAFPVRHGVAARQAALAPSHKIALAQSSGNRIAPAPGLAMPSTTTHAIRAHFVPAPTPVTPDSDAAAVAPEPVVQPAPVPGAIAVAVAAPVGTQSPRPVYGPVDTEAPLSSGTGTIGSGQMPGYAFTVGASGAHP